MLEAAFNFLSVHSCFQRHLTSPYPATMEGWQVGLATGRALHPLSNLAFLLLQLVAYWEKTFKIDLFKPQIGVVNVTDVSILTEGWSDTLLAAMQAQAQNHSGVYNSEEPLGLFQTLAVWPKTGL